MQQHAEVYNNHSIKYQNEMKYLKNGHSSEVNIERSRLQNFIHHNFLLYLLVFFLWHQFESTLSGLKQLKTNHNEWSSSLAAVIQKLTLFPYFYISQFDAKICCCLGAKPYHVEKSMLFICNNPRFHVYIPEVLGAAITPPRCTCGGSDWLTSIHIRSWRLDYSTFDQQKGTLAGIPP